MQADIRSATLFQNQYQVEHLERAREFIAHVLQKINKLCAVALLSEYQICLRNTLSQENIHELFVFTDCSQASRNG